MIQKNITAEFYDGKERQIRVLLPDDFQKAQTLYPVLYMFDGQNLFDAEDSTIGVTWGVREALENLTASGGLEPLVIVGIDHAEERRVEEYGPFDMELDGWKLEGEGSIFSEFVVKQLIPSLELQFPLRQDRAGRFLAGSSMGGVITAYMAFRYPEHFSRFGVFSLAAWVSQEAFYGFLETEGRVSDQAFYLQVGKREGLDTKTRQEDLKISRLYWEDTLRFQETLRRLGIPKDHITLRVGEQDWHSEVCWSRYMPEFLAWLRQGLEKRGEECEPV